MAVTECQKYLNGGFHTPYAPPDVRNLFDHVCAYTNHLVVPRYLNCHNIFDQASESACAYYNSNFDSYPGEYIDFLKSYFIAQIDAFEYGDKVRAARL